MMQKMFFKHQKYIWNFLTQKHIEFQGHSQHIIAF